MTHNSTLRSALPALFVLLAACGSDPTAKPSRSRSDVVASGRSAAPTEHAATVASARTPAEVGGVDGGVDEPTAATEPDDASFAIVAATFTHGVESRRPVDEARSFEIGERATLHLVVKNLGAPQDVTVEWLRGETVLGRMTLPVGTSPSWRTWATHRVGTRDVETGVQVRVLDADGNVLHQGHASVTDTAGPIPAA